MGRSAGAVRVRRTTDPKRGQRAIGSVVLGLLLFAAFGLGGGFGARALGAATTVTVISGDVQVRHGVYGAFVTATDGEVLAAGDTIRTGDGARAILTYFEGSTVSVEPNTELLIDEASAATGGGTIVVMRQSFGRTWHVVTKLITGDSRYEVRTPASTASVRGTAFQVESDRDQTAITTTEGTVVALVVDPERLGQTVEVAVPAGKSHTQKRNARPAPTASAPQPERTLTVTLDDQNSLVIDTQGRANGIDRNGKVRLETPGARLVRTSDGKLQIVLPNVADGRLEALVRRTEGVEVSVETTVEDRGEEPVKAQVTVRADVSGQGRVSVDVQRAANGKSQVKQSTPSPNSRTLVPGGAVSSEKRP